MTISNAEKALMGHVIRDLTYDIKNLPDKLWLIPAAISHIVHLTKLDEDKVSQFVRGWWPS